MLTNDDVLWMKENRSEVVFNRESPITLVNVSEGVKDEWTGEVSEVITQTKTTAVVTELSSMTGAGVDETIVNGIVIEKGDIAISLSIENATDKDTLERVICDDKTYKVMAVDGKGIGMMNRYEILGREMT